MKFALENDLAGVMVWSLDTDDFHGDCTEVLSNDDNRINFPLMNAINKSIREVIEDIEINKKNEIVHGKHDAKDETAAGARFDVNGVLVVAYMLVVICYF